MRYAPLEILDRNTVKLMIDELDEALGEEREKVKAIKQERETLKAEMEAERKRAEEAEKEPAAERLRMPCYLHVAFTGTAGTPGSSCSF